MFILYKIWFHWFKESRVCKIKFDVFFIEYSIDIKELFEKFTWEILSWNFYFLEENFQILLEVFEIPLKFLGFFKECLDDDYLHFHFLIEGKVLIVWNYLKEILFAGYRIFIDEEQFLNERWFVAFYLYELLYDNLVALEILKIL